MSPMMVHLAHLRVEGRREHDVADPRRRRRRDDADADLGLVFGESRRHQEDLVGAVDGAPDVRLGPEITDHRVRDAQAPEPLGRGLARRQRADLGAAADEVPDGRNADRARGADDDDDDY